MAETVLITGATGLIGSALSRHFEAKGYEVIRARRDIDEAVKSNVRIDYIVHTAAMTSSKAFVEQPVETIDSVVFLTKKVLEFARERKVKSLVYLSTMEVYGSPSTDPVTEKDYGYLDSAAVRSSYPEAKRLAENMCVAYAKEYGVPVKIARLTQTFGEGVKYDDGRVFAEFARAAIERRDIVLKTEGRTARCYCYLGDAVTAIETILEKGTDGEAYNVANPATYSTIREMAELVAAANPPVKVVIDTAGAEKRGFAPEFRMRLSTVKLEALGWRPEVDLAEMFSRLIADMAARKEV